MFFSLVLMPTTCLAATYEENLKDMAETLAVQATRAEKFTLGVTDFPNLDGRVNSVGRFLAEELSVWLVRSMELQLVDRHRLAKILEEHKVSQIESADPATMRKIGAEAKVDGLVVGTVSETSEGLRVTAKVIATSNGRVIAAHKTNLAKTGIIGELLKQEEKLLQQKELEEKRAKMIPPPPPNLPHHANELYRFTVTGAKKFGERVILDVTVENLSMKDLHLSCRFRETYLTDNTGAEWRLDIEEHREGLCIRGLSLPRGGRERLSLEFVAPTAGAGSQFTLHYYEGEPRRDSVFTIGGIQAHTQPQKKDGQQAPTTEPKDKHSSEHDKQHTHGSHLQFVTERP